MSPRRVLVAAVAVAAVVFTLGTGTSFSGWTTGKVTNSVDNVAAASLAFSHTYPSGTCAVTARGSGATTCAGSLSPAAAVTAGGVSAVDSVLNNGTLTAAQLVSDFRALSCGPARLADTVVAADPMLPRNSVAFAQSDPWGTTSAATFSSGAYASDVVATSTGTLLGSNYALGVWFKVANGYAGGGPLISLGVSPVDSSSAAGTPMLWMDTAGKVRFRVTGTLGTSSSGVSAAAYNDGSWHLAVLSVAATIVSTPTLYVDNAGGVTGVGLAALSGGNAYWHLGWADFTGVGSAPAATLPGSLAGAFTTTATVSSATRTTLFGSASASAYATAVQALSGISHLWRLDDTGTSTYGGSLPVIGATSPCSMVDLGWTATGPSGTVVAAGTKLSTFADGTWHTVAAPAPGATQTVTLSAARDATWNAYVSGLRLVLPLEHRIQAAPAGGAWIRTFSWASADAAVIG